MPTATGRAASGLGCLKSALLKAVEQGALATVEALAQVLSVSTRTVLRDIQALGDMGITVRTRRPTDR